MLPILNSTGSISHGETPWDDGSPELTSTDQDHIKSIVKKANTASLMDVFKFYSINLDQYNKKMVCPFPKHKEDSPSFVFYPDTNSFWCFGCSTGRTPVIFVSNIENISKIDAANKILKILDIDVSDEINTINNDIEEKYKEKISLILNFSKKVRESLTLNPSKENIYFLEQITKAFDKIYQKYPKIDNQGLKSIIDKLILKVNKNE